MKWWDASGGQRAASIFTTEKQKEGSRDVSRMVCVAFCQVAATSPQKALCTSFGFWKIGRRVHHSLCQHSACHFSAGVNWSHIGVTFTVMANWLATEELFANALKWFFPHYIFCAMQLYHPRVAICLDNKPQGSLRQLYQWSVKSDYTGVESLKTHWSLYLVQCTMPPLVLFIDFPGSDDQLEWFCVNKIERPRQDMELSKFLARIK